ncbi:Hint domain-containing protein [Roseovarius sp. 2305UL8-3]|uniref:Hint domain-containing protein n=1 Tax=Roseovarius conchicola TaxID=3121636 RepID=UPI003528ACF8
MSETTGAYDGGAIGMSSGVISGSRVATAMGWRSVEALAVGDLVLTFDAGLQPVTRITRKPIWAVDATAPRNLWPLRVPRGALGNRNEQLLLPNQYVMIESDAGEDLFGDPFSLIKANALEGVNGIEATPPASGQEAVVLHFDRDQVIFDATGVMFYCPSSGDLLDHASSPYNALNRQDAEVLVMCIESEAATSLVWQAEPQMAPNYAMA